MKPTPSGCSAPPPTPYVKDAFHAYVVNGNRGAVNPADGHQGGGALRRTVAAGQTITSRLASVIHGRRSSAGIALRGLRRALWQRKEEADEFYDVVLGRQLSADAKLVARQAFAGMLWSKQYYHYVVTDWLEGDPAEPAPPPQRREAEPRLDASVQPRRDLDARQVGVPLVRDLGPGFHCGALAHVDPQFAKDQIILMLREWYMHPNGQCRPTSGILAT